METRWLSIVLTVSLAATALADYPADRKAAANLMNTGKTTEAMAAFTTLAAGEVTDAQKSDALDQAGRCAIRLNQFDKAIEIALQIPLKPVSITLQMDILDNQQKSPEILSKFKDEAIDAWPDQYKGQGFFARGRAAFYQKNGALAEADLVKAIQYLADDNEKGEAINHLGDTYRIILKDNAKAIATYRTITTTRNEYKHAYAAIALAGIFAGQKEFDQAFAELGKIKMEQMESPYWRVSMLMGYGSTYTAQGKKTEAAAKYREALQVKGIETYHKAACEKALAELQAP